MELRWLRHIEFFPPWRPDLRDSGELCIATKSRNLGDALALSTLPGRLKQKHPDIRITTYPRGFNSLVFMNNPAVSGVRYLPREVYGDDANFGGGQLIGQKEEFFGLERSRPARPELHLGTQEGAWIEAFLTDHLLPGNERKPLCVIHPWGATNRRVLPVEFWDAWVGRWSHRFRFWQAGILGQSAVQGCEYYFLLPPRRHHCRKLFALLSRTQAFVGVDSGPMHVARAFDVPSLILVDHPDPNEILARREREPYFLHGNWRYSTLYSENRHAGITATGKEIDLFLEGVVS